MAGHVVSPMRSYDLFCQIIDQKINKKIRDGLLLMYIGNDALAEPVSKQSQGGGFGEWCVACMK